MNRIAAIGDSLTYGAGVTPGEAMPAQLELSLNGADLGGFYEVANLGRNGSNLWHAWSTFEHHYADLGFDAVLLTVCNNDTRMFENVATYGRKEFPWSGTAQFDAARKTFGKIAAFARARGMLAMVTFYTLKASDDERVDAVARACADAGLPFVELRDHLARTLGAFGPEHVVSRFDGHPSARTHQAVSRQLARQMRAHDGAFTRPAGTVDLEAEIERLLEEMRRRHREPDQYLGWGLRTLEVKRLAWRRRLAKPADIDARRLDELEERLRQRHAVWRRHREISATLVGAGRVGDGNWPLDRGWARLDAYRSSMVDVDECLYLLESGVTEGHERRLDELLLPFFDGNRAAIEVLEPGDLASAKARADELLGLLAPSGIDGLAEASPHPAVRSCCELTAQLARQLDRMARLLAGERHDGGKLFRVALHLLATATKYMDEFGRSLRFAARDERGAAPPCTSIDVVLEAPEGSGDASLLGLLEVTVDAAQPSRRRFSERQVCGLEEPRRSYRFELPFFALADVHVRIRPRLAQHDHIAAGRLRISAIRVCNSVPDAGDPGGAWWSAVAGEQASAIRLASIRPTVPGRVRETPRLAPRPASSPDLFAPSRRFDSRHWIPIRCRVARDDGCAAPGNLVAARLVERADVNVSHCLRRSFAVTDHSFAFSLFARAGERTALWIWMGTTDTAGRAEACFDLRHGVAERQACIGSCAADLRSGMVALPDGWWWCWISAQLTGLQRGQILIAPAGADRSLAYDGDGRSGLWLSGGRLECGVHAILDATSRADA